MFEHIHGGSGFLWAVGDHQAYSNRGINPHPFPVARPDDFNTLTIDVAPEKVHYVVNGHTVYEDATPSPASPWLYLEAARRKTFYRNFALKGDPRIPARCG